MDRVESFCFLLRVSALVLNGLYFVVLQSRAGSLRCERTAQGGGGGGGSDFSFQHCAYAWSVWSAQYPNDHTQQCNSHTLGTGTTNTLPALTPISLLPYFPEDKSHLLFFTLQFKGKRGVRLTNEHAVLLK